MLGWYQFAALGPLRALRAVNLYLHLGLMPSHGCTQQHTRILVCIPSLCAVGRSINMHVPSDLAIYIHIKGALRAELYTACMGARGQYLYSYSTEGL